MATKQQSFGAAITVGQKFLGNYRRTQMGRGRPKKKIRQKQDKDLRYHIPAESLYIALDELNFAWFQYEVDSVKDMWERGEDIREIANKVDRP